MSKHEHSQSFGAVVIGICCQYSEEKSVFIYQHKSAFILLFCHSQELTWKKQTIGIIIHVMLHFYESKMALIDNFTKQNAEEFFFFNGIVDDLCAFAYTCQNDLSLLYQFIWDTSRTTTNDFGVEDACIPSTQVNYRRDFFSPFHSPCAFIPLYAYARSIILNIK